MPPVHRIALATLIAALAGAAPALADSTTTQTLSPGGSMSTGTDVSKDDPAQLTITAPKGGSWTIQKITSPTYPGGDAYVGPEFKVTPPTFSGTDQTADDQNQQQLTLTFLIDPSIMPRSGNQGDVTGRAGSASIAIYFPNLSNPSTYFPQTGNGPGDDSGVRGKNLPNGDVQILIPATNDLGGNGGTSIFIAHKPWLVEMFGSRDRDLDSSLSKGVAMGVGCTLLCYQDVTLQVSRSVARTLHLRSTTVGHGKIDGPTGNVPLSAAFKRAVRRYKKVVVTATDVFTGPDTGDRETKHLRLTLKRDSELE